MSLYKIHPIVMGTKVFDKSFMTYQFGYGQQYTIPIYSWYIEGGGRKILVDTGELSPARSEAREQAIGGRIYTSLEHGLARWDTGPEQIDTIIHTHLHNDHCENDEKCVNARIYVHEKEMQTIFEPRDLDYRYMEDYISGVHENGQITTTDKDIEVAPGITMFHTPAHTEGGMSVMIETKEGRAIITGFCCIMENFNPPPPVRGMGLEVIPPGTVINPYAAYDILLKVKGMADILMPFHEPKFAAIDTIG
ncbi:MAG: N-acyl homoserine lactonase family protein [Candidatus Magnetominusculus sp. LBB02]|nr:N-acyl homoserine lactonase family protein [Candidatus Magnetominusculus sp. LBB02]